MNKYLSAKSFSIKEVKMLEKEVNLMEFSEEIDISYEYLRHIVSPGGQKSLSFYSMYKIAKVLGVTMDELCEGIFDDKQGK